MSHIFNLFVMVRGHTVLRKGIPMTNRLAVIILFLSLLAGAVATPSWAIETHELIVRNGLARSISLEIHENVSAAEPETYAIQGRWEILFKKVKIDLSDPAALR